MYQLKVLLSLIIFVNNNDVSTYTVVYDSLTERSFRTPRSLNQMFLTNFVFFCSINLYKCFQLKESSCLHKILKLYQLFYVQKFNSEKKVYCFKKFFSLLKHCIFYSFTCLQIKLSYTNYNNQY